MNETEITEFVLIGFSGRPKTRMALAIFITIMYLVTIVANGLITLVVISESRLHNPMYFFLCNLSIIDICLCTTSVPQAIANCLVERPVMSFARCYTQMYAGIYFGSTECFLLAVMAYDRHVAISNPLHYTIVMNWRVCTLLVLGTWLLAFLLAIVPWIANPAQVCERNEIDHISCELTAFMKLICSNMARSQLMLNLNSTAIVLFPFCFILFSYLRIIVAILRIHSAGGRWKAFSTCGSHLAVVAVFFGNCIVTYIKPLSKDGQDSGKILSVINGVVVPTVNPLIYTLRNQEVKSALKQLTRKKL
ncbi:olfactory receptor 2A12-like [Tiliqua scincoides]|uniref:olfactory receptor 2A12-like n=1 Tax=Tiliqua scincoides TaxID=71010 RepID=UPI0034626F66